MKRKRLPFQNHAIKPLFKIIANYYLVGVLCAIVFLFEFFYFPTIRDTPYMIFLYILFGGTFLGCIGYVFYLSFTKLKKVDTKQFRREIYHYFRRTEWGYETTITNIKVYQTMKNVVVEIETHRPGILIGKAGHYINGLTKWLQEEIDPTVKVDIKECKLWHNLYN